MVLSLRELLPANPMELPVFNGEDDAYGWVLDIDKFLAEMGISSTSKLLIAVSALQGPPLQWWLQWSHHHPTASWESFIAPFLWHFKPEWQHLLPTPDEPCVVHADSVIYTIQEPVAFISDLLDETAHTTTQSPPIQEPISVVTAEQSCLPSPIQEQNSEVIVITTYVDDQQATAGLPPLSKSMDLYLPSRERSSPSSEVTVIDSSYPFLVFVQPAYCGVLYGNDKVSQMFKLYSKVLSDFHCVFDEKTLRGTCYFSLLNGSLHFKQWDPGTNKAPKNGFPISNSRLLLLEDNTVFENNDEWLLEDKV